MVTSLKLSKMLWDKGLKIQPEKWWTLETTGYQIRTDFRQAFADNIKDKQIDHCPAYLTDELLAVLPGHIKVLSISATETVYFEIRKWRDNVNNIVYCVEYKGGSSYAMQPSKQDKSLTEALGLMCFELLLNGYIYSKKTKMLKKRGKHGNW